MRIAILTISALLGLSATVSAGEKNMMHCFAYTTVEGATQEQWDAFYKASDALPKKMKGIVVRVWYGKLRNPLGIFRLPDAAASKKLRAGEKSVTTEVQYTPRQAGMCMELKGHDSLKAYAEHPYHKEWEAAYSKVRVAGTTTYDILGQ